jgi:Holliday junction resolvase RusA-like endonuclease
MSIVSFEIPGNPVAKGRARAFKRVNYIAHYTPEKTVNYENLVKMVAMQDMKGKQLIAGPISMVISLFFQIPESWSNKKRLSALNGTVRPTVKPDLDNCCKVVADALNGVVWHDDKQVVEVTVKKFYSDRPRANVSITELS